jgi:hypothetical protein
MFPLIASEIATRLQVTREFVSLLASLQTTHPGQTSTCKGFAFIELYGTYEYTVQTAVQATLSSLRSDPVTIRQLRRELFSLVLDPHWTAAANAGRARIWDTRLSLISQLDSVESVSTLQETLFPLDGSHYRPSQLYTVWRVFGLSTTIVPAPRLLGRIDELVENRNAIAHGRITATEVGRRYSIGDVTARVDDTEAICNHIVDTLRLHYGSGALVNP